MKPKQTWTLLVGLLLVVGCGGKPEEEETADSKSDEAGQTAQGESNADDANDVIVAGEGDFNIKMPLAAPREGLPDPDRLPPMKLRLMADNTGRLASIRLNERLFDNWAAVRNQIVTILGNDRGPSSRQETTELEISCDYNLRYEHVINAITAVSGYVDENGWLVMLIEKIRFSPPKKMPPPPSDAQPGGPEDPREGDSARPAETDHDQKVNLRESELAKPPVTPYEEPIVLQVTKSGDVILHGEKLPMEAMPRRMRQERQHLQSKGVSLGDTTVIIRADSDCPTGKIQELIRICQEQQFERFALRAKNPT